VWPVFDTIKIVTCLIGLLNELELRKYLKLLGLGSDQNQKRNLEESCESLIVGAADVGETRRGR